MNGFRQEFRQFVFTLPPCDANYDSFIEQLDAAGYVIVPKEPTRDMVLEGLHPAIPGNVSEIYREMIKSAPKVAL